jgi:hypothetical protein
MEVFCCSKLFYQKREQKRSRIVKKKHPTLKQQWEEFERQLMPPNASKIQIQEMRLAFYCGAFLFYRLLFNLNAEKLTKEERRARFLKLRKEMDPYVKVTGKEFNHDSP